MIVKNEEAHLERCLKSIKGLGTIYILDTGSTDKTIEIARRYTDKIFEDYKWNDNFAEARNRILAKCNDDWVLSIDADEFLVTQDGIVEAIEKAEAEKFRTISITLEAERNKAQHYFPRIFKNCREVFWKGAVHNYMSIAESNPSSIKIVYGYSEAHKKDPDRAIRILSKEAQKPGHIRERFYLAREYWYRRNYQTALSWYKAYLDKARWGPEMADAYVMMARCYIAIKDYAPARICCMKAININADYKEALHLMGSLTGPNNSARWFEAAHRATNKNVLFINDVRTVRDKQLILCIPGIFDYKSVLYIGANIHRCHILKDFRNHGYEIDIVEPFEANCKHYRDVIGISDVHKSTIQDLLLNHVYDVVFWWHGPEHIEQRELPDTLAKMESMATKYIVLATPWGNNPQDAIDNNKYEVHVNSLYEDNFRAHGYSVSTIGTKDNWDSNLLAWKRRK